MDDYEFALCLTHDVDRVYKTFQGPYYALFGNRRYHLRTTLPDRNPYWQFDHIMNLEDELGVRSAFYFLVEKRLFSDKPPRSWLDPRNWFRFLGNYDVRDPEIAAVIERLDECGWEIGLHGSYESYDDPERLAYEKRILESVLGHPITGVRQHYLNLSIPQTWRHQAALGFDYDASLGFSTASGYHHGYEVWQPFGDRFAVFPLTMMEVALPDPGTDFEAAWRRCKGLLDEAREESAVATALWHPRYFSEADFPGYTRLYRRTIERALEMGAWVGPPGELYSRVVVDSPRDRLEQLEPVD